jgi:hypothetical protein
VPDRVKSQLREGFAKRGVCVCGFLVAVVDWSSFVGNGKSWKNSVAPCGSCDSGSDTKANTKKPKTTKNQKNTNKQKNKQTKKGDKDPRHKMPFRLTVTTKKITNKKSGQRSTAKDAYLVNNNNPDKIKKHKSNNKQTSSSFYSLK